MDERERNWLVQMKKIIKFSIKEFLLMREMSSRWFWVSKLLKNVDFG